MGRLKRKLTSTREGMFHWHQERSILEVTELACEIMQRDGVSRKELADRLSTTKGYITQLLNGTANMTLRKVSDLFTALGYEFHPSATVDEESPFQVSELEPKKVEATSTISGHFTKEATTSTPLSFDSDTTPYYFADCIPA